MEKNINLPDPEVVLDIVSRLDIVVGEYERYKDRLSSVPYRRFADLVGIVRIERRDTEGDIIYGDLTEEEKKKLDLTDDEIFELTLNMLEQSRPVLICSVKSYIEQNSSDDCSMLCDDDLYLLSNNSIVHGSSVIFYRGLLDKIAEKLETGYYIVPSSINELLVIPDDKLVTPLSMILFTIEHVNNTVVRYEDVMSYHLYYYDFEKRQISVIGKKY